MPISPMEAKRAEKAWRKSEQKKLFNLYVEMVDQALIQGERKIRVDAPWDVERLKNTRIRPETMGKMLKDAYFRSGWNVFVNNISTWSFYLELSPRKLTPLEQIAVCAE